MIQAIPPSQFERVFQVKYRPKLYFNQKLPKSFLDQCAKYNSTTRTMRPLGALNDYKRKISTGYVISSYIAKVSDKVGYGLFAHRDIKAGEMLGEYTGALTQNWAPKLRKPSDFKPYLFHFPFGSSYAIDAEKEGNEIRFINHSSFHNNAERHYVFHSKLLRVILVATRLIPRHEQILFDYGKNYWRFTSPVELRGK